MVILLSLLTTLLSGSRRWLHLTTLEKRMHNHVIAWFGVPQEIVTNHRKHFRINMMTKLASKFGLSHESSTPYYLHANG